MAIVERLAAKVALHLRVLAANMKMDAFTAMELVSAVAACSNVQAANVPFVVVAVPPTFPTLVQLLSMRGCVIIARSLCE